MFLRLTTKAYFPTICNIRTSEAAISTNLEKIIVVPKLSRYEFDRITLGLAHDELTSKYIADGESDEDIEVIMASDKRQKDSLEKIKNFFREDQIVSRDALTGEIAEKSELVIALGGDDNLKFVSHFLVDTPIMGVNSDPLTSEGALNYFTADNFDNVIVSLKRDDFEIEEWTRLEAEINGKPIQAATSEYILNKRDDSKISHYVLEFNGRKERQKSSGLLVATGAGSTGFYDSACRYIFPEGNVFSRTAKSAAFLTREVYRGKLTSYSVLEGVIHEGEELVVQSKNGNLGRVSADSIRDYEFRSGSKAVIRISDKPLNVLKMKT